MAGLEGLLTGRTLAGRYLIEEVIGRGGMAAVFRARDEVLRRTVAIKVITLAAGGDDEERERSRARFHREAQALARLQHPHVVTVYDFGTDGELGLDFLVMELLHGEDLASRMRREGRLPAELALRVLREAAYGIGVGHRAGLIHRDVKPGNLFLARSEAAGGFRVVVLDFGIARIIAGDDSLASLTRGHSPLSPAYASPEQLAGESPVTPASDVYSLGVVAYELLTGARPVEPEFGRGRDSRIPPLRDAHPEVPPALAAVVDRALAPDPAERFADAEEFGAALDRTLSAPTAPPGDHTLEVEPPQYRARRQPRLPPRPAHPVPPAVGEAGRPARAGRWVALSLVAMLALALGWWALGRGDGGPAPTEAGDDPGRPTLAERGPGGEAEPAAADPFAPEAPVSGAGGEPAAAPAGGGGGGAGAAPAGGDAEALNREGLSLLQRGSTAAAVARFRRAVELAPRNVMFRNNLGWALYRAGELGEAARELERVLDIDPRRDIAHANLGEVRLAQGDTAAGIAAYQRFLDLNSDPTRERIASEKLARLRAPR